MIGIIDSGIDTTHPAFTGRILQIWDHTLSNDGNSEYPEGLELTGNLPKRILAMSRDQTGHGTHIAGIAAGNDPAFTGVAPAADLVIVKAVLTYSRRCTNAGFFSQKKKLTAVYTEVMSSPCV
nr:S8 family serine peptidase [Okeania sp. SIO3B5]